jgi:hypothetical protein
VTAHSAANVLLIAAAVGWILARQIRPAPVRPRLLVLAPLLLAYSGLRALPAPLWHDAADLALLGVSAAVSAGLGVWRGRTIAVWRDAEGVWWRRGSRLTLALWGAQLAARGLLSVVDLAAGRPEASGAGALLLVLAIGFAAQNAVTAARMTTAAVPAPVTAR